MTIEQFAAYVLYQCKAEKTEARRSAYELVHHYLTQVTGAQGGHTKKDVKQLLGRTTRSGEKRGRA